MTDGNTLLLQSGGQARGEFNNAGTIQLSSAGSPTDLVIAGTITLSGTTLSLSSNPFQRQQQLLFNSIVPIGRLTLSNNASNAVVSNGNSAILENLNNTISGAGTIGDLHLTLANDSTGLIDATGTAALTLATGGNTIINSGTIEATGTGGLIIESNLLQCGKLSTAAAGSTIKIASVTITGGTVSTVAGSTLVATGPTPGMPGGASTRTEAAGRATVFG